MLRRVALVRTDVSEELSAFHPRHENQIYGPQCQGGHWDWIPPLQYQQRVWLLSQYIMEASYRFLKTFGTWPKDTWRRDSAFITCLQTIQPYRSTETWDLALYSGHLQPHATTPSPCICNSVFHPSFLSHLACLCSVRRLLVTASVVPSSPILATLVKEALSSSETSVLTRGTRRTHPRRRHSS
jgi:hypothetical protein